jgi:hypothetical protein
VICTLLNLRLGERVVYQRRVFRVRGFTPASVDPPRVWLEDTDAKAEQLVEIEGRERIADLTRPGEPKHQLRGPARSSV